MIRPLALALAILQLAAAGPARAAPPEGAVVVPGGRFLMGCSAGDADCRTDEGPAGGTCRAAASTSK